MGFVYAHARQTCLAIELRTRVRELMSGEQIGTKRQCTTYTARHGMHM